MKNLRKILVIFMISLGLFSTSCKSENKVEEKKEDKKEVSKVEENKNNSKDVDEKKEYEKFIEIQSDPNSYGKPQAFTIDKEIKIDLNRELPKNEFCKTIGEAIELGNEYVRKYTEGQPSRAKREQMILEYEKTAKTLVPLMKILDLKPLATFEVNVNDLKLENGNISSSEEDTSKAAFERFKSIIPENWRKNINKYEIVREDSPLGAYVKRENKIMTFGINLNLFEKSPEPIQNYVFIHEFGHLFSFDNSQHIENVKRVDDLVTFKEDSYLKEFYNSFWKNAPKNWIVNYKKQQKDVDEFYKLNRDKFITAYAVNNIYEDFADSFAFFVLEECPIDSDRDVDKKLKFFYQYPELVLLRLEILKAITD